MATPRYFQQSALLRAIRHDTSPQAFEGQPAAVASDSGAASVFWRGELAPRRARRSGICSDRASVPEPVRASGRTRSCAWRQRYVREGRIPYVPLPKRGGRSGVRFLRHQLLQWLEARSIKPARGSRVATR
jgi:hypothetical protein